MKYETYLYMRKAYRSSLKHLQLKLGQQHYEELKTATGSVTGNGLSDEPRYGVRDETMRDFQQRLEIESYVMLLRSLELEAEFGFEYERSGISLINSILPRLSKDQKDIRRSDFKRYTDYPRMTAIWTAISFVIFAIASLVILPSLMTGTAGGILTQTAVIGAPTLQWQGAVGAMLIGTGIFVLYKAIKSRFKKAEWRLRSSGLKRYFLGTRSMHWGRKLQIVAVYSIGNLWNLLWGPWVLPGRVFFSVLFLVINQRRFVKTRDETEAFVAAWRFGLMFIMTIEICLSIVGILAGILFIVVP